MLGSRCLTPSFPITSFSPRFKNSRQLPSMRSAVLQPKTRATSFQSRFQPWQALLRASETHRRTLLKRVSPQLDLFSFLLITAHSPAAIATANLRPEKKKGKVRPCAFIRHLLTPHVCRGLANVLGCPKTPLTPTMKTSPRSWLTLSPIPVQTAVRTRDIRSKTAQFCHCCQQLR